MTGPTKCPGEVHIYPQGTHRCCLICEQRKPFDPADFFDPWPSWDGLKAGDEIQIHYAGGPEFLPAVVISTHRLGAQVEVYAPRATPWIQFVMGKCRDGAYAR